MPLESDAASLHRFLDAVRDVRLHAGLPSVHDVRHDRRSLPRAVHDRWNKRNSSVGKNWENDAY